MLTASELAGGLAAERARFTGRLLARGQPKAEVALRTWQLMLVHADEAALYGFPALAGEIRHAARSGLRTTR